MMVGNIGRRQHQLNMMAGNIGRRHVEMVRNLQCTNVYLKNHMFTYDFFLRYLKNYEK